MSIVAGVDFGTLSVRVSIVDSVRGRIGSGAGTRELEEALYQLSYPEQRPL